jgi:hypothetical protein
MTKDDRPDGSVLSEGLGPLPEPDLLVDCAQSFVRGWTKSALEGVLKLAAFGAWCAREFRRDLADVDGGSAQDEMARIGVLELHEALEPCGKGCVCAEYGDFPHECFRLAADVRPLVDGGPNKASVAQRSSSTN